MSELFYGKYYAVGCTADGYFVQDLGDGTTAFQPTAPSKWSVEALKECNDKANEYEGMAKDAKYDEWD